MVADAAWPTFDPALLVDDQVTLAVQVNGKLRDTLTAPRGLDRAAAEALALASDKVQRQLGGASAAQGDCRSRPAGEYRRMMRARSPSLAGAAALGGCGLQPLYARRRRAARSRRRCARSQVAPIQGQVGWLVRNKLVDRLGDGGSGDAALSARRRARRQYHRLRHPRRPRGDARAADAARALPAGRPRQRRRWCSTPPPDPTPESTSSAPNMRPSPPSRPRLERLVGRRRRPDRRAARRCYASRTAPAQVKAAKGSIGRAVDQPDPTVRFYLFHGPDEAQSRALGDAAARRRSAPSKFVVAAGSGQGGSRRCSPTKPAR